MKRVTLRRTVRLRRVAISRGSALKAGVSAKRKSQRVRVRLRRASDKQKSIELRLAELRLYVLERDEYRCRSCRAMGVRLDIDHIEKRSQAPHLKLEPLNLLTLCRKCHNWKDNGDPHSPMGRLKVERHGQVVTFKIDYEGKLMRLAGALFLNGNTNQMTVEKKYIASGKPVDAA